MIIQLDISQVLSKKPVGRRCDVFSYAIVVWELLTHKLPYELINDFEIYPHVVKQEKVGCQLPLPLNSMMPAVVQSFMGIALRMH